MATGLCACGITSIIVGAIMTIVCLAIHFTEPEFENYEIRRNTVVDSKNSPAYPQWQNLCNPKLPPLYMSFWLFNLTNWHDVIYNKAIPNFQKCGPYTYLECQERMYVEFSPDGTNVTYSDQYTYYWNAELSNGTEDDVIINLNLAALAAYALTGNEEMVGAGLSFDYLSSSVAYFSQIFPNYVLNVYFNTSITSRESALLPTVGNDEASFANVWANYTSADFISNQLNQTQWTGMYLSADNNDTATGIPSDVALNLWDPSYPYSMVNGSYESQTLWLGADQNDQTSNLKIISLFPGLTEPQLKVIVYWRTSSKQLLAPALIADINNLPAAQIKGNKVSSLSDIGALQWATGAVVSPQSYDTVFSFVPQDWKDEFDRSILPIRSKDQITELVENEALIIPSFFPPELWYYQELTGSKTTFTVENYNSLFMKEDPSLLKIANFTEFFICLHYEYTAPNFDLSVKGLACSFITSPYGLNTAQKKLFYTYMTQYIYDNFAPIAFLPVTGAGLIDAETVRQRLWFGPLGVAEGNVTLKDTNSTYLTGKNNISQIDQIVIWEYLSYLPNYVNNTFVDGYWPIDQPIFGAGTGMYFPYGTGDEHENIYIWDSDILRPVLFNWNESTKVMGIDGYKYVMPTSMLNIDPGYDQYIVGTVNLTHLSIQETQDVVLAYNNATHKNKIFAPEYYNVTEVVLPIFLTFADMYYLDENVRRTVTGLQPNWDNDNIYVTIEPNTGLTIEARKMLQENIYITQERFGSVFTNYYKNITGPYDQVMWPVAVIDEHGSLDKKTAHSLKVLLVDIPDIGEYALWIGVPVFSLLLLGGSVMFWLHTRNIKKIDYLEINDEVSSE